MKIACGCVCPTHKMLIACRCVTVSVELTRDSVMMGPPLLRACMPAVLKERAYAIPASMVMCMLKSTSESQDEDRMLMCLSNSMLIKRRFRTAEAAFQNSFSKHLSTICSPNRVLTPLKSASRETHSETFVRPSKIFVWEV
jgi:hypothetical protein